MIRENHSLSNSRRTY